MAVQHIDKIEIPWLDGQRLRRNLTSGLSAPLVQSKLQMVAVAATPDVSRGPGKNLSR